ncbi:MAG: NAD-dependent epimerase/dehydratase family protein [Erysipelotrichia bacterium]|nr:NAD-dependent epimerase/dehydratase family protein [Erysipelotrichia bacterium]
MNDNSFALQGANVAITGAAGFIGSHLTGALLAAGARVTALTHYNSRSDIGWLKEAALDPNLTIINGDIRDPFLVDRLLTGADTVFHLAALIGIPFSYTAPQSYIETNVTGTLNILEAARRNRLRRVVLTSTSEVYGTAIRVPIDEDHPLQAQSPYSASKISSDMLGKAYACSFGLPVTIVRPFNTFGPRQSLRAVIPTIIVQALQSGRIELGNLAPVRDFNYVSDTVAGFIAAATKGGDKADIYNLATGKARSIGETAQIISELTNVNMQIEHDRHRERPAGSEVMQLLGNAEKARKELGWQPQTDFKQGLAMSVEWFREHLHNYPDAKTYKT